MNIKIFYYTSTGNSLYVAKRIATAFNNSELIGITYSLKNKIFQYRCDTAIFVYPVHCFALPIIVADFIKYIELSNCKYIYSVAVSGGDKGKLSAQQLNRMLTKFGGVKNYSTIKYESNYIKSETLDTLKINLYDEINESIIDNIIGEIQNKTERPIKSTFRPYSNLIWRKFFKGKDNKFTVNENCIGCKICERVCPTDNITLESKKPIWDVNCMDYMSCINLCPKNAINLSKKTIQRPRYKNKNITVDELFTK
ncbi:MAG: EFR1 family ferrodoxin [Sarcina sp.]